MNASAFWSVVACAVRLVSVESR